MNIAIVEDCADDRVRLQTYIDRYAQENNVAVNVTNFVDGLDLIDNYKPVYHLILLDIEMKHSNGMDIAAEIRKRDKDVLIVFTTNMAQYAVQGYKVEAMGFIVKPIQYTDFAVNLDRALAAARRREQDSVVFKTDGKIVRFSVKDIKYVEVIRHQLVVHTATGNYDVWHMPISAVEQRLAEYGFARCNECYLVNLAYVDHIGGNEVTVGGENLLISRGKKKSFLQAFSDYVGG